MVLEAGGEGEEDNGRPVTGKAGHYLFQQLARIEIDREDFRIDNCCKCRPPNNKLAGMWYEKAAVAHCAPNLDATIAEVKERCKEIGKHFTILALGKTAFKRIMELEDKDPILSVDYFCYPFFNEKYQAYVVAIPHPSYLMRGNHHLVPVLQFAAKRAIEIAESGCKYVEPKYLRDPDPATFAVWVSDYFEHLLSFPEATYLAFDIETPYKQDKDEEKVSKEGDDDYTILRCSFSYKPGEAVSVPWRAEYMPYLEQLFSSVGTKLAHNANYDVPRISCQLPINGTIIDSMVAWHVLNSALPKSLGFIAPFYCQDIHLWKHLSKTDPAGYNCQDSDITLRIYLGIEKDLKKTNLWSVFDRHVIQLNKALTYMSRMGVLKDEEERQKAEIKLQLLLDDIEAHMEGSVPQEARKLKVFKKAPKNTSGMVEVAGVKKVKVCPSCGTEGVKIGHFKPKIIKQCSHCDVEKWTKAHEKKNPGHDPVRIDLNKCSMRKAEVREVPCKLWAKPIEWKISKVGLSSYQKSLKHSAILSRKERKVTFDENAIIKLMKKYPKDPLYPKILEHREVQKLLGTYVGVTQLDGTIRGGMPTGKDGRIHTTFTHNPNTLRLASQDPNLQNLPRPDSSNPDALCNIIRNLIVAGKGNILHARDYSGIEAVLVGYFSCSPSYIRLAKLDVHSFYTAYALHELDGRVSTMDLPQLSWSDERLASHLAGIKQEFKYDRNTLYKHLIHGANFFQGALGAQAKILKETGIEYPVSKISKVMGIYFELFPEIKRWHNSIWAQAEKDGFLKNPFGYTLRFYKVYDYEREGNKWIKKPGPDANRVAAFLPQSTAAGIIKEAILKLWFDHFDLAGQYLRLQVHDELLSEVPEAQLEVFDRIVKQIMEAPISALALPSSYGMGSHLVINTEAKTGLRWGSMR